MYRSREGGEDRCWHCLCAPGDKPSRGKAELSTVGQRLGCCCSLSVSGSSTLRPWGFWYGLAAVSENGAASMEKDTFVQNGQKSLPQPGDRTRVLVYHRGTLWWADLSWEESNKVQREFLITSWHLPQWWCSEFKNTVGRLHLSFSIKIPRGRVIRPISGQKYVCGESRCHCRGCTKAKACWPSPASRCQLWAVVWGCESELKGLGWDLLTSPVGLYHT